MRKARETIVESCRPRRVVLQAGPPFYTWNGGSCHSQSESFVDIEAVSEKSPLTVALAFFIDRRLMVYKDTRPDSRKSAPPPKAWVMTRVVPPTQASLKQQAKM